MELPSKSLSQALFGLLTSLSNSSSTASEFSWSVSVFVQRFLCAEKGGMAAPRVAFVNPSWCEWMTGGGVWGAEDSPLHKSRCSVSSFNSSMMEPSTEGAPESRIGV